MVLKKIKAYNYATLSVPEQLVYEAISYSFVKAQKLPSYKLSIPLRYIVNFVNYKGRRSYTYRHVQRLIKSLVDKGKIARTVFYYPDSKGVMRKHSKFQLVYF